MRRFYFSLRSQFSELGVDDDVIFESLDKSPAITEKDLLAAGRIQSSISFARARKTLFASSPVRSKPRRTYDPAPVGSDPEGVYVPMYLANLYFQNTKGWTTLKSALEDFGRTSGLFDEIGIRPLSKRESEPFQLQIRKFDEGLKGPPRNMIDVGYGVSQVLPVITELLRSDAPSVFLLQQPESTFIQALKPLLEAFSVRLPARVGNSWWRLIATTCSIACAWTYATGAGNCHLKACRSCSSSVAFGCPHPLPQIGWGRERPECAGGLPAVLSGRNERSLGF